MIFDSVISMVKLAAEMAVPFECCGLIDYDGNLIACTNGARDRRTQFFIDPPEFKRASRGRNIVGVYHSHVDQSAYLSANDKQGMTFNGLYIVASVIEGRARDAKVWLHKDGQFTPVEIPGK